MSFFWILIFAVLFVSLSLGTIYLALDGLVRLPKHKDVLESQAFWIPMFFPLLLFIPWMIGGYARGETSALPWKAFLDATASDGIFHGIFMCVWTALTDLWLLWIPANIWINSRSDLEKQKKYMARTIGGGPRNLDNRISSDIACVERS